MEGFENVLQKTNTKIAASLENQGKSFTEDLYRWNQPLVDKYIKQGFPYITILFSMDLTWSGHAKYNDMENFLNEILPWMESNQSADISFAQRWHRYFGRDALIATMEGIRLLKDTISPYAPDLTICDTKELLKFQNYALREAINLVNDGYIHGVGAWLFLGFFKLILSVEKRLWNAPNIDSIVLPSGRSVVKGIRRLLNEAPSFSQFDLNWLQDNEPSIERSSGTELLIHDECRRIANMVGSKAMHINSALYLYGRGDIDI